MEVSQRVQSNAKADSIIPHVTDLLRRECVRDLARLERTAGEGSYGQTFLREGVVGMGSAGQLATHVEKVVVSLPSGRESVAFSAATLRYHVFKLDDQGGKAEEPSRAEQSRAEQSAEQGAKQ